MPKRPARPRDTNQLAKLIVDLATGEQTEESVRQNRPRQRAGSKGGKARSKALTPEQRSAIAKGAAAARWGRRETQ